MYVKNQDNARLVLRSCHDTIYLIWVILTKPIRIQIHMQKFPSVRGPSDVSFRVKYFRLRKTPRLLPILPFIPLFKLFSKLPQDNKPTVCGGLHTQGNIY